MTPEDREGWGAVALFALACTIVVGALLIWG